MPVNTMQVLQGKCSLGIDFLSVRMNSSEGIFITSSSGVCHIHYCFYIII